MSLGASHPAFLAPAQKAEVIASYSDMMKPPGSSCEKQKETQHLRQADPLVLPAIVDQANT